MTNSQTNEDPSDGTGRGRNPGLDPVAGRRPDRPDTRQRILEVALDLFTEHGYDGTSLREIADELGITKAALYYYFESKEDIFLALHMRLHEFGKDALVRLGDQPVTLQLWSELLDELIDQILAQRQIFLMHLRNEATARKTPQPQPTTAEHEDIQNRLRLILSDPNIPLEGPGAHGGFRGRAVFGFLPLRRCLRRKLGARTGNTAPRGASRRPAGLTTPQKERPGQLPSLLTRRVHQAEWSIRTERIIQRPRPKQWQKQLK